MASKRPPIQLGDGTAVVPLTCGMVAIIDAADIAIVGRYTWRALRGARTWYAVTLPRKRGPCLLMHRLIANADAGLLVDHIDENGLNNVRSNLRQATQAQNQANCGLRKSNTSGFKGARLDRRRGLWYAQIRVNGKRVYLGSFPSAEEAGRAYAEAAKRLHGAFARIA